MKTLGLSEALYCRLLIRAMPVIEIFCYFPLSYVIKYKHTFRVCCFVEKESGYLQLIVVEKNLVVKHECSGWTKSTHYCLFFWESREHLLVVRLEKVVHA